MSEAKSAGDRMLVFRNIILLNNYALFEELVYALSSK